MHIITVVITPAEGKKDAYVEMLLQNDKAALAEEGCVNFEVLTYPDSDKIMLFEVWQSEEALKKHVSDPAFQAKQAEQKKLAAGPAEVKVWQ